MVKVMDNREDNHELSLSLGEVYRGDNYRVIIIPRSESVTEKDNH